MVKVHRMHYEINIKKQTSEVMRRKKRSILRKIKMNGVPFLYMGEYLIHLRHHHHHHQRCRFQCNNLYKCPVFNPKMQSHKAMCFYGHIVMTTRNLIQALFNSKYPQFFRY